MTPNPKDFATLEEFLAAVLVKAMQKWAKAKADTPMPSPQHGGGGGP